MQNTAQPSTRAQITERRTYLRPINDAGTEFETFEQSVDRMIGHQRWLWERAKAGMRRDEYGDWMLAPLNTEQEAELEELRALLLDRKVNLSGRTRWLGGTSVAQTRESSQFNCAFLEVRTVHDVVDVLWLLLQGCGVGFRPIVGNLNGFGHEIPEIEVIRSTRTGKGGRSKNREKFDPDTGVWTISIGDSAEAWAKSVGKLVAGKYKAKKLVIDLSQIRPAGERLKGYGWISSGDEQIAVAYPAIAKILNKRAGQLLTRMDILDIVNWLGTVLSSRRSAEIALFEVGEPEWEEFAVAKKDFWLHDNGHRTQSNNSLIFSHTPSREELEHIFNLMVEAGGSEPGFMNIQEALRRGPWTKGTNPCVTGDTMVMTSEGLRPVVELVDVPHRSVVQGQEHAATGFWYSGTKPVFEVVTDSGYSVRATGNHKVLTENRGWVEVDDLQIGDKMVISNPGEREWGAEGEEDLGWVLGEIVGDGGYSADRKYHAYARFWGESQEQMAEKVALVVAGMEQDYHSPTPHRGVVINKRHNTSQVMSRKLTELCDRFLDGDKTITPTIEKQSSSFVRGFLRGYFDADGSVQGSLDGKGTSVRLASVNRDNLKAVQRMLLSLGIVSRIYWNRLPAGERLLPDSNRELRAYECQAAHELVVSRNSLDVFYRRVGFAEPAKMERLAQIAANRKRTPYRDRLTTAVVSKKLDGVEKVYDCTVEDVHCFSANGLVVHNCGEILLGDHNFCNLVETVLSRFNGDYNGLLRAHWIVARANYRQTCVWLDDGILQRSWHELNEFLRLCGVGVTGVVAWAGADSPTAWEDLRLAAHDGANSMADELGMPRSKAITTIKPSGTQSKASGIVGFEVPEGVHKPLGRYIFNNINMSKHDPLVGILQAAGYHTFPNPGDTTGVLVRVPVEYGNISFDRVERDGVVLEVNLESAVSQLERYKLVMQHYVDHNCSITVSYDPSEVPAIIDWLLENWDTTIGVSFLFRNDPTKTAADLGYLYLPQQVVTAEEYHAYADTLRLIDWSGSGGEFDVDSGPDCATGACPVI